MKTEISRNSHQPGKCYSGVYQQQGRMLTDADWNELVEILKDRLDDALKDVVGNGSPLHRNVINNQTAPPQLQWGHVYVDGIHSLVRPDASGVADFDFERQRDFPLPPTPGSTGDYRLYADVWERTVTHLMDSRLRDKGLHGADTSTRKQTLAQVKWCPREIDPMQSVKNPSKGNAGLTVTLLRKTTQPDPCDPCADQVEIDARLGNYLFRVEIHDVRGDADNPEEITLKWSSENGAEQYALQDETGTELTLPADFTSGRWVYEFFDETSERHLGVHLVPGFSPSREALIGEYPTAVPSRAFVRRWDGYCTLRKNGTWEVAEQFDRYQSGTASASFAETTGNELTVNLDAQTLTLPLNSFFVAGDYWMAEIREAEHKAGDEVLTEKAPEGIEHHYLTLGEVVGGELQPNQEADRKYAFPPLTEMTRLFHVGGDGQEAMPSHRVPQSVKAGVTNGEWPVIGAKIEFTVTEGGGRLVEHPDFPLANVDSSSNPTKGIATTAGGARSGRAQCGWQLGAGGGSTPEEKEQRRRQRLTARLIDPDSVPGDADYPRYLNHPPIHFYANLSTADQVAYENPTCTDSPSVNSLLETDLGSNWPDFDGDGDSTVKDALDVLLCKLRARHIPYDPTNLPRWNDVNLEESGGVPTTVQAAIDALLANLHSEDITYPLPDCSPATNTLKTHLQSHIAHNTADAPDRFRLSALWDALLCQLDAAKLPYNPNESSQTNARWRDIGEQPGSGDLTEPNTVQEAIDQLITGLEAEDIPYQVPGCGSASSPTVRSGLAIPAGAGKIKQVLDKLLCELTAAELPLNRGAELCEALEADADIKTVQDAINALCRKEGGGCAVTVGIGGKYPTVEAAFESEELRNASHVSLCLLPLAQGGSHFIEQLNVPGKTSISISGKSAATVVVQGAISLGAAEISITGLTFLFVNKSARSSTGTGSLVLSAGKAGKVTVEDCMFSRAFDGTDTAWRPMVSVTGRARLSWTSNRMRAVRQRRNILNAAVASRAEIPVEARDAFDTVTAIWRMSPYEDTEAFESRLSEGAEMVAALAPDARREWSARRRTSRIDRLPAASVRLARTGRAFGRVEPAAGRVSPAPGAGTASRRERMATAPEASPREEVSRFYDLLGASGAVDRAEILDVIRAVAEIVSGADYALALESNSVEGWVADNDIGGYLGLHYEQTKATQLTWPSTQPRQRQANKTSWANKNFPDDLSPGGQLHLHANQFLAVHSMVQQETLDAVHEALENGRIGAINIQAYESLSVRDNVFAEAGSSFIGLFLNADGNNFLFESEKETILAYTLGLRGTFLGNMSNAVPVEEAYQGYVIEQIFKHAIMQAGLNMVQIV